jgi:formiminoglutamase
MNDEMPPLYVPLSTFPYKGREDSQAHERVFQQISLCDLRIDTPKQQITLAGFCSDEGVRRNLGRVGAHAGPSAFREVFGRLPLPKRLPLIDVGDVHCQGEELENAQAALSELVCHLHLHQNKPLLIGGGHEISYGHYMGLMKAYPDKRIGILNFDAHFDLRPANNGASSGTPFRQIAEAQRLAGRPFDYACIGISELANTNSLFQTAKELGVNFLSQKIIYESALEKQKAFISTFCQPLDALYLTICLDVFNQAFAPGVSAPEALGLAPFHVIPLLLHTLNEIAVISIDFAELSPPFDPLGKTARLASDLAAHLLINW